MIKNTSGMIMSDDFNINYYLREISKTNAKGIKDQLSQIECVENSSFQNFTPVIMPIP